MLFAIGIVAWTTLGTSHSRNHSSDGHSPTMLRAGEARPAELAMATGMPAGEDMLVLAKVAAKVAVAAILGFVALLYVLGYFANIIMGTTSRMVLAMRTPSQEAVPLGEVPSPFVHGLRVTARLGDQSSVPLEKSSSRRPPIVVGTIRMGFGHHRIAYATASWGLDSGRQTYFHDFLGIDSPEAELIRSQDKVYSRCSRLATEMGGVIEKFWGNITKSGGDKVLQANMRLAEHLKPLLLDLPKDTPIIASHCFIALTAVACGFTKVINLVIDNHAQWFVFVPGALNLVQGPSNYHSLLKMGVKPEEVQVAGHWIPKELVDNIHTDCRMRKQRLKAKAPCRLLITVGGAGAQRKFVTGLVRALEAKVKAGTAWLFLNVGDHAHMKSALTDCLKQMGVEYTTIDSMEGVHSFCEKLLHGGNPQASVTVFAFASYFPAVATTDVVMRVSDVLCAKPSELAFYPIPKLNVRRVGDHEAYSAIRSSEIGDGTFEVREVSDAIRYIDLFQETELLSQMNDCIMHNNTIGVYNGCKRAVEIACQM